MKADVNIGSLVASLGMDTSEFERALKDAKGKVDDAEESMSKSMDDIGKSMQKTGQKMQQFGRNVSQYITLPMVAAAGAALKMEAAFETQMTKIISLVGVAREQVTGWRDDVLALAGETGRAPKELAEGLYFITSAGLRGAEAMEVLEASAKASAAGLGDVKLVADNVTSAVNAYKNTNLGAAEATDILINAVRLGKVEAEDMAVAMGHVFPVASRLGVSFNEVAASVASLTRTGTPAETAAVQMRQALGQLVGPAEEAKDALNQLNWSSSEFRKAIAEEGLFPALETFTDKVDKFGNIEIAKKVFGNIRALTGIFDIMGGNIEHNRMIFEEMQDSLGRTNRAFEIVSMTLQQKWNVAMANMKAALITVGEELKKTVIPILMDLSDWLRDARDWFQSLTDAQKELILKAAGVVAALGPVIMVFGGLVKAVGIAISAIATFGTKLKALYASFVAMSGPIGILIGVLGALGAAYYVVNKGIDVFASGQNRAKKALGDVTKQVNKHVAQSKLLFQELEGLELQESLDNIQKQRKRELITEINKRYGEYLPFLIDENSTLKQIHESQQAVNTELARNIQQKAIKERKEKALNSLLEEQSDLYVRVYEELDEYGFSASTAHKIANEAAKGNVKEVRKLVNEWKEIENLDLSFWDWFMRGESIISIGLSDKINRFSKEIEETEEYVEGLSKGLIAFQQDLQGIDPEVLAEVDEDSKKISKTLDDLTRTSRVFGEQFDNLKDPLAQTFEGLKNDISDAEKEIINYITAGKKVSDEMIQNLTNLKIEARGIQNTFEELVKGARELPKQLEEVDFNLKTPELKDDLFDPKTQLGQTNALSAAMGQLSKEFSIIDEKAKMLAFDINPVEEKMNAVKNVMDRLTNKFSANSEVMKELRGEYLKFRKEFDIMSATAKKGVWESIGDEIKETEILMQALKSSVSDVTSAFGDMFDKEENAWDNLVSSILSSAKQIIDALFATAVAALITGEITSKGIFGLATAAAGIAALKSLWDAHIQRKQEKENEMASGGIAYGPTSAVIGEYPGAKSNPEVVAPLDTLKSMIDAGGSGGQWETASVDIPGDTIRIMLEKNRRKRNLMG